MPPETRNRRAIAAIAVVSLLTFLYAALVVQQPLLWLLLTLFLVMLYFAWQFLHVARRFVRALERIADAMES